ncbi:hypothetical protein AVEN_144440-1 [Araneus ventricosus]|uniref:Uncharacterized protein n=1 Tax=Araneus ventricosus TaxID=182803 RepID=A0A4Y2E499_ARAVE|nr:hypothetical protein AVEN_144440-1 [Araneus ventricosus]
MDAIKRASFASKQIRAGPAPLASFEDLPSDELESPDDIPNVPIHTSSALDDESGSDLQFTTPDSLTVSSQSTPRIECDFDSHFTLTPGDSYEGHPSSELRTTSLSSLSKEASLNIKQKKGSAHSLCTVEASETELIQRKSSWTDIFRTHNQNSAKSSTPTVSKLDASDKASKKKTRSELPKRDSAESTKQKEKSKFLSIFKKKSNKSLTSPLSPGEIIVSNENLSESVQNLPDDELPTKAANGNISKGKENELPKEIELCPTVSEVQNDLGKVNTERNDKIPDERKINRKLINISEKSFDKEYNILSKQDEEKQVDKMSKSENIQAIVAEQEHESSESELVFEEKDPVTEEKKEDDFEAENLISQDLSEMDEDSVIEIQPVAIEPPKQTIIPSRQQRLEVTTKPIDRPRSTTPINCAPLEAFIQSVSPTFVSKDEKIKLSLPGEQFVGRVKSPKKSSIKSWTDFCESVLHSPRMHKRTDTDDQNPFSDGANFPSDVPFSETSDNWANFESNFSSSGFGDNFTTLGSSESASVHDEQNPNRLIDPYQPFEADFSKLSCSCECHNVSCTDLTGSEQSNNTQSNISEKGLSSPVGACSCNCQLQPNAVPEDGKSTLLGDSFKSCDATDAFLTAGFTKRGDNGVASHLED